MKTVDINIEPLSLYRHETIKDVIEHESVYLVTNPFYTGEIRLLEEMTKNLIARVYLIDGVFHREDGPAVDNIKQKYQQWYLYGQLHREDGPACIYETEGQREWYQYGELHREDGPAMEFTTEPKYNVYYLRGFDYDKEVYDSIIRARKLETFLDND